MVVSSILLIFLLIAAYYIYVLYNNLDLSTASYAQMELKLQTSAAKYVNKYNLGDLRRIISLESLQKEGYIDIFTDSNDDECNGYVIYQNKEYNSYISCKHYKSFGYNQSYE